MGFVNIVNTPVLVDETTQLDRPVYRVDLTKNKGETGPFCVVANTIYDAADWVRSNIVERGFVVTNVRGW